MRPHISLQPAAPDLTSLAFFIKIVAIAGKAIGIARNCRLFTIAAISTATTPAASATPPTPWGSRLLFTLGSRLCLGVIA